MKISNIYFAICLDCVTFDNIKKLLYRLCFRIAYHQNKITEKFYFCNFLRVNALGRFFAFEKSVIPAVYQLTLAPQKYLGSG